MDGFRAKKIITGHPKYDTYYINNQTANKLTKANFYFNKFHFANPRL